MNEFITYFAAVSLKTVGSSRFVKPVLSQNVQLRLHPNLATAAAGAIKVNKYYNNKLDSQALRTGILKMLKPYMAMTLKALLRDVDTYKVASPKLLKAGRLVANVRKFEGKSIPAIVRAYESKDLLAVAEILNSDPEAINAGRVDHNSLEKHSFDRTWVSILHSISDPNERIALAKQTQSIVQDNSQIFLVMSVLSRMPSAERVDIVKHVQSLKTEKMGGSDVSDFIRDLREVPLAERADIVGHVQSLKTEGMNSYEISKLIRVLSRIPLAERVDIVKHVQSLKTEQMGDSDIMRLIYLLSKIRLAERADIVAHVLSLKTEKMDRQDMINIIDILSSIPLAKRAKVVASVKSEIATRVNGRYMIADLLGLAAYRIS